MVKDRIPELVVDVGDFSLGIGDCHDGMLVQRSLQVVHFIARCIELIRNGVRLLLEQEPDCVVCGEATNGRDAVDLAEKLKPLGGVSPLTPDISH